MASTTHQRLPSLPLCIIALSIHFITPVTALPLSTLSKRNECDIGTNTCPDNNSYWKYILIPVVVVLLVGILFVAVVTFASKRAQSTSTSTPNQSSSNHSNNTTRSQSRSFFSDFITVMSGVHPTAPLSVPVTTVTTPARTANPPSLPKISTAQMYEVGPSDNSLNMLTPPPKSHLRSTSSLTLASPVSSKAG